MQEGKENITYNIKQVADLTGLSRQVIRKWEERYQIVTPKRLDNGYRIYNKTELKRIQAIKILVDSGHTVKQAVNDIQEYTDTDTNTEKTIAKRNHMIPVMNQPECADNFIDELIQAGEKCNNEDLNIILQLAYHSYNLDTFLQDIVLPFLKRIGELWHDGLWGEYQETFSSTFIRDFLIQIRRDFQVNPNNPVILGACLPGEVHEIPLHAILLKCMLYGYQTVLIGPSPAPKTIEAMVEQIKPKIVLLSALTTKPFDNNPNLLEELDDFSGKYPDIDFYLGGPGSMKASEGKTVKHLAITNDITTIFTNENGQTRIY